MHRIPQSRPQFNKVTKKNSMTTKGRRGRLALQQATSACAEVLEGRQLLTAVIAAALPVINGDSVTGPLTAQPGQSLYVSGVTSTGGFVSQWGSASAITPNTTNDLVLNVSPFSNNYHPTAEAAGSLPTALTNGITQTQVSPGSGTQPAIGDGGVNDPSNSANIISDTAAPYFFNYNLGAASGHISATGYDLSEIDVITGHQDGRVAITSVDVLVEPVGSSHFISLSGGAGFSLVNALQVPIAIGSAQMAIVNNVPGQPIATNIQAVELSVLNPQTFFREFVATGTASTHVLPLTAAPTGVGVTFSPTIGNTVSWMAPSSGATGYTVLRATSLSGPYTAIGSVAGQTSFIDANVQPSTSYFYEIIASGNGDSPVSALGSIVTPNFGPVARVVPPDPIIFGDTVSGPLAPQPGHSFYVSGNNSAGAAISQWANTSAITPNTQNDLLLNVAPYDIGGYVPAAEGATSAPGNTSPLNSARLLTNGITQSQVGDFPATGAVAAVGTGNASDASSGANVVSQFNTPYSFSYNLGAQPGGTASGTGYDLSEIDIIAGHQDVRSAIPLIDILVEPVGSTQFYSLSLGKGFSLTQVPDGNGGTVAIAKGSAQMAIVSSAAGQPIATNIQALKLSELTTGNPATFFREMVVTGTASAVLPPPASAPSNVAVSLAPYPTVTWTPPSGAVGYLVQRSTSISGPYVTVGSLLSQTSFTDIGALPNTTYYYVVAASGNGDSVASAPSNPITTPNFGASAYFFHNQLWGGAATPVEQLPQINYSGTATSTGFPLPSGIAATSFSTIIEGKLTTDLAGTYAFGANTDDAGYLYVNGQLVSTNAGTHAQRLANVTIPISLAANTSYDFVFLANQGANTWGFQMYWQEPTASGILGPITPVPGIQMTPAVDPPPTVGAVTATALSDRAVQLSWAPTGDLSSYGYVIQRAPADASGNPIGSFSTVTTAFSGPTTLTSLGALTWGISTFTDVTVAPNSMYVYQVGAVLPGQTTPTAFSPISTPVTTTAAPVVPTVLADGTLNINMGPSDVCTVTTDSSGNILFNEGGVTTTFPSNNVPAIQSLKITGVAGSPATVNLNTLSLPGAISIDQVSDVFVGGAVTASQVHIASNNITVSVAMNTTGPVAAGAPQVDFQASNNITLNASITATGPINLIADNDLNSSGTLTIAAAATVTSGNNAITTHFSTFTLNGNINAGSGDVTYAGTGNSFNATGYATHTTSSGTIMLTSGSASLTRPSASGADTWGAGATGTVFYNFPALTNGFTVNSTGISTSAGNANLKISVPVLITISAPLNAGAGQVTLSASNVNINTTTLNSPGVSDLTGTLTVPSNQSLTLQAPANGPVTLTANMILSSGATMHVSGSLVLNSSTITVNGGTVTFDGTGSQTLSGSGQILFGAGNGKLFVANGALTIGSGITLTGAPGAAGNVSIGKNDGHAIVNAGTIDANQTGLNITALSFTNQGTVRATGGGALTVLGISGNVGAGYSASGAGSKLTLSGGGTPPGAVYTVDSGLSASAGATLDLEGNWNNNSTITLDNSSINLGGAFLTSQIGNISATGSSTVNISGFLDNRASSGQGLLALSPSGGTWNLAAGGTIMGGTVTGAPLNSTSGVTLDGVTLDTPLNIHSANVLVLDGLTLTDSTTVSLFSTSAAGSSLVFGNTETIGMVSGQGFIVFNGVAPTDVGFMPIGQNGAAATLTVGSGVSIVTGTGSAIIGSGTAGNDIINNGTIGSSGAESVTLLDPIDGASAGSIVGSPHTTAYWTGAHGNDWTDPLNWLTNAVPTSDQAVVINGNPGANTITIASGTQSIYSLSSSWPILLAAGAESLAVATTAQLSADLTLAGGTLLGGNYSESSGHHILMSGNATLDGVTLNTGISIGSSQTLDVRHSLTLAGSSALTLLGGTLSFDGTQTLGGAGSLVFGAAGGNTVLVNSDGGASGTLTIAPSLTISSAATGGSAADTFAAGDLNLDSIVNQGAMIFTTTNTVQPPQTISINGLEFANQGTLTLNKSRLSLAVPSHAWSNTGTINLTNATIDDAADTLTNAGTISGSAFFNTSLVNSSVINLFGAAVRVSGTVTNASSGNIHITKIQAVFDGFMDDAGSIKTTGAIARYLGGASVSGSYVSDPSSNFFSDLTITGGGQVSSGQPDTSTGASDLFVVSGNLANTSTVASDTSGAQLEFQGAASHEVTGSFSFSSLIVDAGSAVTLTPAADTTFTVTDVVNNGSLAIQAPLTSSGAFTNNGALDVQAPTTTGALTNNAGASLQINSTFTAPAIENVSGANLTINTPAVTTTVDNQGTLAVNAPAPAVTLAPTSTGTVTFGTTTVVSAAGGTYGDTAFALSAHITAANGATPGGTVSFTVLDGQNSQIGSLSAPVTAPGGDASTTFTLTGLNAGTYTVRADYHAVLGAGLTDSTSTTTLIIAPAALTVAANPATKVYGAADPAFGVSFNAAEFKFGDRPASLAGTVTFTTNEPAVGNAPAGSYAITPEGLSSPNYAITFVAGTLTVTRASLTVAANSASKAYGAADPAFSANITGLVSGDTAASLGGSLSFSTNEPAGNAPVGAYTITPSGVSSPNYAITFVPATLTVIAGGTQVDYVGATYATATSKGAAAVLLRADLKTAPGSSADIRNASVSFLVYDGATLVATVAGSQVGLVNSASTATGSSTATWNANIGKLDSAAYQVVVVIGGSFTGTTAQPTLVLVERASSQAIAGAGDVISTSNSAGTYALPAGARVGYAFAVQTAGQQSSGTADIVFQLKASDGKLHSYLVTSTSILSYGSDPVTGKASILAAADLLDVTNPLAPVTIAAGVTLQFSAVDSGGSHAADSIGITLWSGSTLLFSSDWDGLQTVNDNLADGLNQVRPTGH